MGGGGSSGVHAMDGQSGDGAREGETLGKRSSHSESEALGTGGSHPESDALGQKGVVMDTATNTTTSPQSLGGAYQATRVPKHPA